MSALVRYRNYTRDAVQSRLWLKSESKARFSGRFNGGATETEELEKRKAIPKAKREAEASRKL